MKLVGIEFHGFKSFADSQSIRFHDGITAIVGPNGCGKSNVADGLRWVLGEQRPTAIRGSRMEEAIFQGTEKRRPIHRAEVNLKLSNEDGALPVPYSDVEIARTVYTGGEGEYRLNNAQCRLRDIQDLCRDTGLGTNAYAIIEGRMVDAILSDKAEERRAMFEEAAGIGRYKERRRIAVRRLDEADTDIARVDDVIAEVGTKVRSLARQRGKAQRFLEMRDRKLALELALAHTELERLGRRQHEIDSELRSLADARVQDTTQLRTAEAEHEALRGRLAELDRQRGDDGRKLMAVRDRLAERERQRLLADERVRHATGRLEDIESERRELEQEKQELEAEVGRLEELVAERRSSLEGLRDELRSLEVDLAEVSERKQAMEAAEAAVESEKQAYRERRASLQARRDAARAEAAELLRRLEEAEHRIDAIEGSRREARAAEDEARGAAATAEAGWQRAAEELAGQRDRLAELEAERDELRGRVAALNERRQAVRARIEALAALSDEGGSPAVAAALERADQLGILGRLGEMITTSDELAESIEAYLGAFVDGLVVEDRAAVERIRRWFLNEYQGPGGLVVLPLEPVRFADGRLPPGVQARGPAARWVARLLQGVDVGARQRSGGRPWIGRRESVDAHGVLRLGQPHGGGGTLVRKAERERLESQLEELEDEARRVGAQLRASDARVANQASAVAQLEADRRTAGEEAARAKARAEGAAERLGRLQEELESAREAMTRLEAERTAALERGAAEEEALASLKPQGTEVAPDSEELAAVRSEWEGLRERVTEARLAEARAAAALDRAERELRGQRSALNGAAERSARLGREAEELRAGLSDDRAESEKAAEDLEALFEERDTLERASAELDEEADELRRRVTELESQLRKVQQEERSHAERRHELELERTQIGAELSRTSERLEDEWGRPFDELAQEVEPAEGEPGDLRAELTEVAGWLGRAGLVNMLAEEEYREEKERLEFLEAQRADLAQARDDLRDTVREINETASATFLDTLAQIRTNFNRTFATLFAGGECDVWLEDPSDPLDSPIEISASPGGKRTQRIHLLSGGERALTALSLLFAIYLVKPSPFCVLDEVDAPLDETNIRRFVSMLEQFKPSVQFVVITHNPVTIEAADWIYGVTMEEPGVSKIVGVEFSEYARGAVA
ncbi:MAG: chromosome segregation protein SMC [Gemmatimonadetes bacterium]|uniref:Chromosome partition protein Smc n=1 Tax=Candidatus Kutchimonas denitrificans TaxID=3056748 RepID=A0AAE4Z741_9BACT|nr:chromosome segregation protein SMC [Gemmatimonadota bacterium]NIR74990.1 chromosome segregation protein SMC [Candidatus Kutchimonas denitrificans]NIS01573.1 chromosome segregation protein SMC [Gemmatimonadota bacterium]NIT67311.1 chromosome segregation protein SMC [Gemmatimonadota bacterium]NIU52674.1 chromosome segregation protein SMC [Gemmatimonadota bacterium]